MSSRVTFKWNKGFWGECMTSPQLRSALQSAAETQAAVAEARVGACPRRNNLRNDNFYATTATRHGSSSSYLVGLVKAGNPRSIWKSRHEGALG